MHINDLPDSVHERLSQQDIVKLESTFAAYPKICFQRLSGHGNLIFDHNGREIVYDLRHHTLLDNSHGGNVSYQQGAECIFNDLRKIYPFLESYQLVDQTIHFDSSLTGVTLNDLKLPVSGSLKTYQKMVGKITPILSLAFEDALKENLHLEIQKVQDTYHLPARKCTTLYKEDLSFFLDQQQLHLLKALFFHDMNTADSVICVYPRNPHVQVIYHSFCFDMNFAGHFTKPQWQKIHNAVCLYLKIEKHFPKYKAAISFLKEKGVKKITVTKALTLRASFANYGQITIDPQQAYKRKVNHWLKEKELALKQALLEQQKQVKRNPLFGQILPLEMLEIISSSQGGVSIRALVQIMRGLAGLGEYYFSVKQYFAKKYHGHTFNMLSESDITHCLEQLEQEDLVAWKTIKGRYQSYDVYYLTKNGKLFLEVCLKMKHTLREYADLKQLQTNTHMNDEASCLKTSIELIKKPYSIPLVYDFFCDCANTCLDRLLVYIDLQMQVSDENKKKSLRKVKKLIKH